MNISPEGWWGGRLFSTENKAAKSETTGIVYYDNPISRFFMKRFSFELEIEGKLYFINRESAKKFFFDKPDSKASDVAIASKIVEHYRTKKEPAIEEDTISASETFIDSSSDNMLENHQINAEKSFTISEPYQIGDVIEGEELLVGITPEKAVSTETLICKKLLAENLLRENKVMGHAVDTGDCFYDAIAQKLSQLLGSTVTIKDLRKAVKEELTKIHAQNPNANWVLDALRNNQEEYQELLDECQYSKDDRDEAPLWGRLAIEGRLIAERYQVNITLYEQSADDREVYYIKKYDSLDKEPIEGIIPYAVVFKGEDGTTKIRRTQFVRDAIETKTDTQFQNSIEIAAYPGHFVPVMQP